MYNNHGSAINVADSIPCMTVRTLRAVGIFGFLGGITNWVAIEMLFVRVPFLIGT